MRQRVGLGHALGHHLARAHQVGAGLEDDHHGRQPGKRFGADALHPGHTVEQILLHSEGDELLDFLRGEAERFRLNLHVGQREFRQDVDRHVAEPPHAYH